MRSCLLPAIIGNKDYYTTETEPPTLPVYHLSEKGGREKGRLSAAAPCRLISHTSFYFFLVFVPFIILSNLQLPPNQCPELALLVF